MSIRGEEVKMTTDQAVSHLKEVVGYLPESKDTIAIRTLLAGYEAAKRDIASLAKGEFCICDMCELYGKTKETTPCPVGAYCNDDTGEQCSFVPYPDDACDDFQYKRGPEPGGEGSK